MTTTTARKAELGLTGWHGASWQTVEIVGETPTRYRIKAITKTKLGGRNRWLQPGETSLVPKTAIKLERQHDDPDWQPLGDGLGRVLDSLGRGLKLTVLALLLIMTACTTTQDPRRPQKNPGEVVQEQAQRQSERIVRSTTSQILRAPGRYIQRTINCALRGGC